MRREGGRGVQSVDTSCLLKISMNIQWHTQPDSLTSECLEEIPLLRLVHPEGVGDGHNGMYKSVPPTHRSAPPTPLTGCQSLRWPGTLHSGQR